MGYYSRFTVKQVAGTLVHSGVIADELQKISNGYTFDYDGTGDDEYKWYNYQKDMITLSNLHKDCIFRVHREGEESGDIEDTYYKNGKIVHTERLNSKLPEPDLSKF